MEIENYIKEIRKDGFLLLIGNEFGGMEPTSFPKDNYDKAVSEYENSVGENFYCGLFFVDGDTVIKLMEEIEE